ncbi:MAG: 2-amino-4-hydroxy-6-hydroxymethyldihydropteridine diphosphokinase [Balneolaceae bacterium]
MAKVVIAAGSNLGDRHKYISEAGLFLERISSGPVKRSSIWESEPVGPSRYHFLNAAASIESNLPANKLLDLLKNHEVSAGREPDPARWMPRVIDLDIICIDHLVIRKESLIIPHSEYQNRLFVLFPLREIIPFWIDPVSGRTLDEMIMSAPAMEIEKTDLDW